MIHKKIMIAILALNLGACTSTNGAFPSLAKRPFENKAPPVEQDAKVAVSVLPDETRLKIDALMDRNTLSQAQFVAALPAVKSGVAQAFFASAPVGSEDWVDAQLRLSRLDKARADSVAVQGEMDLLVNAQMDAESQNRSPVYSPLMLSYQREIADVVAAQNMEIAKMTQLLMQ